MRGLFTKIFLSFWFAQSITFVITTVVILQRHFTTPAQHQDLQVATMRAEGIAAADSYERSACSGLAQYATFIAQEIYLADSSGHVLCDPRSAAEYSTAFERANLTSTVASAQIGSKYLSGMPVYSTSGQRYLFVISRPYLPNRASLLRDLRNFSSPQLPVGIVVFGLTTFFLVLLLTRPIGNLRAAARDLASGKLATRVAEPDRGSFFGGDEIQGLAHDFNHMAERLEQLVAAQKMLLRDVSHEVRSPLARLSVALELAREEAPERMQEPLQRIELEAGRLNLLIGDLLRLSSMEASDAPIGSEEFSLNNLLEEMRPDAEFEAQQRSCIVTLRCNCNCTIRGNPQLAYRAIENVVRNAIRYTREGSVVDLELDCEEYGSQQTAVLKVRDQGPGIPENELKNIFQPFYRVDNARQRNTGGFGVGLALTERAVRLHHGEVRAANRPEGGLIVTLKIPCKRIEAVSPVTV